MALRFATLCGEICFQVGKTKGPQLFFLRAGVGDVIFSSFSKRSGGRNFWWYVVVVVE